MVKGGVQSDSCLLPCISNFSYGGWDLPLIMILKYDYNRK